MKSTEEIVREIERRIAAHATYMKSTGERFPGEKCLLVYACKQELDALRNWITEPGEGEE